MFKIIGFINFKKRLILKKNEQVNFFYQSFFKKMDCANSENDSLFRKMIVKKQKSIDFLRPNG